MRKFLSVISLLLCISLALPAVPLLVSGEEAPEMGSYEEIIASYYDPDGRPMSCAHRAITYIGNPIPENSLPAIQDAIDHKVDIVELDIARTKDGVYVLCHDTSINRTTTYNGSLKVSDMTYAEICKYPLLEYTGGSRGVYKDEKGNTLVMPTFEEALQLCRGKIMINLDKFTSQWDNRMELYEIVRRNDCLELVIFKGGYDCSKILSWHKEIKAKYGTDAQMPNFATMNSNRNADAWVNEIRSHHKAKTAFTVEAGFSDYTQPQSDPATLARIRQYTRAFTNVLYESIGGTHSAKHKENSTGWAEVFSLGYNIIQTNNAADLVDYIYANYSKPTRDIGEGLGLLYFSGYRHDQLNYTIAINAPSVKLFENDYIFFRNVDFGSCDADTLIAEITGSSGKGELVIRKGSPTGEVIAKYVLSKLGGRPVNVSAEIQLEGLGVCDIYVCAENMGDGFVSASRLTCADPQEGNIARIEIPSIFTRPGTAPALPEKVSLVNELGFAYESEVVWAPVPEECYSEAPARFTVPGIIKANCQSVSANVTVIDLDMTGAAIWFDSLGEMVLGESGEVLEWYDSINSIAATAQSQTAPKYKDGAISFDGVGDSMVYDHSLSGKSDVSIVVNAKSGKSSTDYYDSFKINNSARYSLLHYPESGSWGSVYFSAFCDGIVCRFGSGEDNNRGIFYSGLTLYGWKTVSAIKKGTSEKIWLGSKAVYDRATDKSNTHQMGTPGESITATKDYAYIGLGIQSATNYYYCGDVRDIVVFERALNKEELAALDAYFKAKNNNTLKDESDVIAAEFESFLANNAESVHALEYTFDADSHTAVCTKCSYTFAEAHTLSYAEKDGENHVKSCSVCSYECEEPHSFIASDPTYKCSFCNAEKPLPEHSGGVLVVCIVSALALAALAATALAVIYKKKRSGR